VWDIQQQLKNPTRTDEEQALPTNNKHSGEHCLLMIDEMTNKQQTLWGTLFIDDR